MKTIDLSPLVPVQQSFPRHAIPELAKSVRGELARASLTTRLRQGTHIAIAVGSRGIADLATIVTAAVAWFQEQGFSPFIVPAMGSHGGGTAEGQAAVLAKYGIISSRMNCEIRSSTDVVSTGQTPDGIETFLDRIAFESGGIFLINRVKPHTTFEARVESGLLKMAAIGLGKVRGAQTYHAEAVRRGLGPVVESVGRHALRSGKILGGLAILEDAHHQVGRVAALSSESLEQQEAELLQLARSWMARLPFEQIDVLIVDEMGKEISGTGMDSKIVNRHPYGAANAWPSAPRITRVYVRSLTPRSYGNAVGIGMADLISRRLDQAIDWDVTKTNALTASNLNIIRRPVVASDDWEAMNMLAAIAGRARPRDVTIVRIKNTLELSDILVSENLLPAVHSRPDLSVHGAALPWTFNRDGELEVSVP